MVGLDSNELRKLADVLENIEKEAKKEMGYTHVSGSFATARLSSYDSKAIIDVVQRYGVQSDCTNIVHTEKLQVNKITMEPMDSREITMKEQLETVVTEMYSLVELWDEKQAKQYPTYLPSFDEFIVDLQNMMHDK